MGLSHNHNDKSTPTVPHLLIVSLTGLRIHKPLKMSLPIDLSVFISLFSVSVFLSISTSVSHCLMLSQSICECACVCVCLCVCVYMLRRDVLFYLCRNFEIKCITGPGFYHLARLVSE